MPRKGHNDYNTRRCGSSFLRQTLPGRDKDSAYDKTQLGSSELVFMKNIVEDFERASNVREVFDVVKDAVKHTLDESRAGIDLGLIDLGNGQNELLSAYYPVGSNIIVLNKTPLKRISQTQPELFKPYVFVVLLHEYLHSLGYIDEDTTRKLTHKITNTIFNGSKQEDAHSASSTVTEMAKDMRKFFPFLLYPGGHPATQKMDLIELDDVDYIG